MNLGLGNHGATREEQVRVMAARLGVADFVYTAPQLRKGSGNREASGDGLLIVGNRGAVLQVKSRIPTNSDSRDRAESWVRKSAMKARKQGLGSKRELARHQALGQPITVSPVRSHTLPSKIRHLYDYSVSDDVRDWPIFVIIDHPRSPDVDLGFFPGLLWFSFEDWRQLQRRLRSTGALLNYAQYVFRQKHHVPLGQEERRYEAIRAVEKSESYLAPTDFPYFSDGSDFDFFGTNLFHDLIDKVWPHDGIVPWESATEYRMIVDFLDAVPPQLQADIGHWILRKRREVNESRAVSSGLAQVPRGRLVYACTQWSHWDKIDQWFAEFSLIAALRHLHALESGAGPETETLAVGVLVKGQGVQYSFAMLRGTEALLPIPRDLRSNMEWRYGIHNHREGTTVEVEVHPNQICPCLSGKRFGACCGEQ